MHSSVINPLTYVETRRDLFGRVHWFTSPNTDGSVTWYELRVLGSGLDNQPDTEPSVVTTIRTEFIYTTLSLVGWVQLKANGKPVLLGGDNEKALVNWMVGLLPATV